MIDPSVPDRATDSPAWILTSLAVFVAAMAFVLVASCAWSVPLQTDGSWYSYPGYALSHRLSRSRRQQQYPPPSALVKRLAAVRHHQLAFPPSGTDLPLAPAT